MGNNPVNATDPSGNIPCDMDAYGQCSLFGEDPNAPPDEPPTDPGGNPGESEGGNFGGQNQTGKCPLIESSVQTNNLTQTTIFQTTTLISTNVDWQNARLSTTAEENYGIGNPFGPTMVFNTSGLSSLDYQWYASINAISIYNDFSGIPPGLYPITTTAFIEERETGNYLTSVNVFNGSRTFLGIRSVEVFGLYPIRSVYGNPNSVIGFRENYPFDINLKLDNYIDSRISVFITVIGGYPENFSVKLIYPSP